MDIFRTLSSAGPQAQWRPLDSELTLEAKPVKVCLRKYSQERERFTHNLVNDLVAKRMACRNLMSK